MTVTTTSGARPRSVRALTAALAALTTVLAACSTSGAGTDAAATAPRVDLTTQSYPTTAEVLAAVAVAQHIEALPAAAEAQLAEPVRAPKSGADHCFDKRDFDAPLNGVQESRAFGECAYGDPHGTKLMVAYGDSRAAMWAGALERVAAINGWQLRVFARDNCPAADLRFRNPRTGSPDDACDIFRAAATEQIRKLGPHLVVATSQAGLGLLDGQWPTPDQWTRGWISTLQTLSAPGTRLALLGAIPDWDNNGAECLTAHRADIQRCSVDVTTTHRDLFDSEKAAATAAGAQYIDTTPWVCAEKCVPVAADIVTYQDGYHLTNRYANQLSGALSEALRGVIQAR